MTAEALQLYAGKLKDDGILVLHISNRYLDLDSVLGATLPLVPQLEGPHRLRRQGGRHLRAEQLDHRRVRQGRARARSLPGDRGCRGLHAEQALALDGRCLRHPGGLPVAVAPHLLGARWAPAKLRPTAAGAKRADFSSKALNIGPKHRIARDHAGRRGDRPAHRAAGAHQDHGRGGHGPGEGAFGHPRLGRAARRGRHALRSSR